MYRVSVWLILTPLIAAQTGPAAGQGVQITSAKRGHIQAKTGAVVLDADGGKLDAATGKLDLEGHARVTLPARNDRNLVRYAGRAVVTDDAVLITADRVTVKDGLLRGRGHVVVRTNDARLQGDEIQVFLRLGDGELRGNIRVNGTPVELLDAHSRDNRLRRPTVVEIMRN